MRCSSLAVFCVMCFSFHFTERGEQQAQKKNSFSCNRIMGDNYTTRDFHERVFLELRSLLPTHHRNRLHKQLRGCWGWRSVKNTKKDYKITIIAPSELRFQIWADEDVDWERVSPFDLVTSCEFSHRVRQQNESLPIPVPNRRFTLPRREHLRQRINGNSQDGTRRNGHAGPFN